MKPTRRAAGCRAAVVNHGGVPLQVIIVPLGVQTGNGGAWIDLVTGVRKPGRRSDGALTITVPAPGYVCWEYRLK
jgi:hypothetical protein